VTTTTSAKDHVITLSALIRGRSSTFTATDESGLNDRTISGADLWEVVEPLPRSRVEEAVYRFAKSVWKIPNVVAVSHSQDGDVNLLWTFIRQRDRNLRKSIYACERALMEMYPELVFNFNVGALDQGATLYLIRDDLNGRIVMCRPEER
jgi:hypothetical protein